jgi:hypothetical protein
MKLDHVAVTFNSEVESDNFFENFLSLRKTRDFTINSTLNETFFGISKEQKILRYENDKFSIEVFITNDNTKSMDLFTHICIKVDDRDNLIEKAKLMNIEYIKEPRKDNDSYYLFIKDSFGNLYEIK